MRKYPSKRPTLATLLQTKDETLAKEVCKDDKCWQTGELNGIKDINKKLEKLGYKIQHYFGIYKLSGNECKFILATSCENHEVLIGVDVLYEDCILMDQTSSQIIPGAICHTFQPLNIEGGSASTSASTSSGSSVANESKLNFDLQGGDNNSHASDSSRVFEPKGSATGLGLKVCVLSHLGIDMLGVNIKNKNDLEDEIDEAKKNGDMEQANKLRHEIINFAFSNGVRDVPKLGRGNKFYQALPFVRIEYLTDDVSTNNLDKFVKENQTLSTFANILRHSDNVNILASAGPFFALIPSNYAFQREFNNETHINSSSNINSNKLQQSPEASPVLKRKADNFVKNLPKEKLNEIVLRHIFLGDFPKDYTGGMTNLLGESFTFVKGRVVRSNLGPAKYQDESFVSDFILLDNNNTPSVNSKTPGINYHLLNLKKSNGTLSVIDELLEPNKTLSVENSINGILSKKFGINSEGLVSDVDIAFLTYKLWNKQNKYDKQTRESLRDQINMMLDKIDQHEQDVEILEDVGQQLLALDERLREVIHLSEVKPDGNQLALRLSAGNIDISDSVTLKLQIWQLSKKYAQHIKQSSQINALEKNLQPISKDLRDL